MPVLVHLADPDLEAHDLQRLTVDLCRTINSETDVTAELPEETAAPGQKGDPVTIGQIILAIVSSGTAAKLFSVFRTYFNRKSSLEIVLQRDDGKEMTIRAENVTADRFGETIALARRFLGETT